MDIITKKQFRRLIVVTVLVTAGLVLAPILLYYLNFRNYGISTQTSDWGVFGDYIGGIIGTVFSLVATTFALISIYVSLKIATFVQQNEIKFNTDSAERELKLVYVQNKPFPFLDLYRADDGISIVIQNLGVGPMIIKKISIVYQDREYFNDFSELLYSKVTERSDEVIVSYNSSPHHILPANGSKELLKVTPKTTINQEFSSFQSLIKEVIKDCRLNFGYEDIFGQQFICGGDLSFFKS